MIFHIEGGNNLLRKDRVEDRLQSRTVGVVGQVGALLGMILPPPRNFPWLVGSERFAVVHSRYLIDVKPLMPAWH